MLNKDLLKKVFIVAHYTFKEVIKSRILINTLVIGLALFVITFIAYSFTYGEPARIALDFGLGSLSLSTVAIAIFIGVGIISNELENRTVYLVISRPIPRYGFYLGKFLGLWGVLLVNVFILSLLTTILYFMLGGSYESLITWAIIFIGIEATLALTIVCLLSMITSKVLAVIMSIVIYIIGHAIDGTKLLTFVRNRPWMEDILNFYHFFLPGFYKLNLKDYILYKQEL